MTTRLISNELYESLPLEVRQKIDRFKQSKTVPAGTRLLNRGVLPDGVYFVDKGTVEITVPGDARAVQLAVAGPGKVFGLRAAVSGALPEINVVCREECVVSVVPRDKFMSVIKDHPEAYIAVARVLSRDLKMADDLRRQLAHAGRQ